MVFHMRVHEKCGKSYKNVEMCKKWGFMQKCEENRKRDTFLNFSTLNYYTFVQLFTTALFYTSFTFIHFFNS